MESLILTFKQFLLSLRKMNQSTVSYFDGVALAKKISAVRYIEVSAITGEGVDEAFQVPFFARKDANLT